MDLYEKNGNILYILNVLKKYSDENHKMSATEIGRKVEEIYSVEIDPRTIRRNINLLKYKLDFDISTRKENGQGYYIIKNPETDFEPGEIRAIIDTFSYANYIVPSICQSIIKKCKNLQNIYENQELKNYKIYSIDNKTTNMEVVKNIEDISKAINGKRKIKIEYWKYAIEKKFDFTKISETVISPYAIVYNDQLFYVIAIKDGENTFYRYRLDRIKNINILKEKRILEKNEKQIEDYAKSTVEAIAGKSEEIEAICQNTLLNPVIDKFGKNITIIKKDSESFRLILDTNKDGFIYWALKNIRDVEVIRPVSLRNEIKEIIKEAEKKYKN